MLLVMFTHNMFTRSITGLSDLSSHSKLLSIHQSFAMSLSFIYNVHVSVWFIGLIVNLRVKALLTHMFHTRCTKSTAH